MTEHKRITGRELIHKILDHPAWLDLPVHVLVMDDGLDGGFLNTVEADRFELDGPDVLSLISEKPAVGHEPGLAARRCTITVDGNRCDKPADHIEHVWSRKDTPISERVRMWLETNPAADPPKLATTRVERKPSTETVSLVDDEDEESTR